jgi:hypothetical protein
VTKPTFEQLSAQLHAELEALFERWPGLHPNYPFVIQLKPWMDMKRAAENFMIALGKAFEPTARQILKDFFELYEKLSRDWFFLKLLSWRVPAKLARLISNYIPMRCIRGKFLPQ